MTELSRTIFPCNRIILSSGILNLIKFAGGGKYLITPTFDKIASLIATNYEIASYIATNYEIATYIATNYEIASHI